MTGIGFRFTRDRLTKKNDIEVVTRLASFGWGFYHAETMPEKKNSDNKPVVIKTEAAVACAEGLPAKVRAHGTVSGEGTLKGRGEAKPVTAELRQDVTTEYRASDGLHWVVIEARKDGQLIDFDLHNLTP